MVAGEGDVHQLPGHDLTGFDDRLVGAGSFAAPSFTVRNRVAQITMLPGTGTETFTWLLMSVMIGSSGGSALVGPLVATGGWRVGVLVAIAIPSVCAPVTLAWRHLIPRR